MPFIVVLTIGCLAVGSDSQDGHNDKEHLLQHQSSGVKAVPLVVPAAQSKSTGQQSHQARNLVLQLHACLGLQSAQAKSLGVGVQ